MKLSINGETRNISFETLGQWVSAEFGCPSESIKGIALAINDAIVPKSKWNSCSLQDGDRILAIRAAQGG